MFNLSESFHYSYTGQYLQDDPLNPSSMAGQIPYIGEHDDISLATWMSWTTTSASQCSQHHHTIDEANDGLALDASLYNSTTRDPVVPSVMEDGTLGWDWGAPDVQPTLDRSSTPCGQSTYEASSSFPSDNQRGHLPLHSWSDTNSKRNPLWLDPSATDTDTESKTLVLEGSVMGNSPRTSGYSYSAPKPRERPGMPFGMSSSSSSSILSFDCVHSVQRRPSSSSSSLAAVAEEQGEESGSSPSQILLSQKPLRQTPPLLSATPEDKLSSPSQKRQFNTGDQQLGPLKKVRKLRTHEMVRHSVSEKRYRTKLNDELGRLRENVPSLRAIPKRSEEYAYREGKDKLDRPEATNKFDKATVVTKGIEYIAYIEMCNKRLSKERIALMDRVSAIQAIACPHIQSPE